MVGLDNLSWLNTSVTRNEWRTTNNWTPDSWCHFSRWQIQFVFVLWEETRGDEKLRRAHPPRPAASMAGALKWTPFVSVNSLQMPAIDDFILFPHSLVGISVFNTRLLNVKFRDQIWPNMSPYAFSLSVCRQTCRAPCAVPTSDR